LLGARVHPEGIEMTSLKGCYLLSFIPELVRRKVLDSGMANLCPVSLTSLISRSTTDYLRACEWNDEYLPAGFSTYELSLMENQLLGGLLERLMP
jgi:hypothetical protein